MSESEEVTGQDLLDIAHASWDEDRKKFRGWQYNMAVGKAKAKIEKKRGGRKERVTEARHQVHTLLLHAMKQEPSRLDAVAREACLLVSNDGGNTFSAASTGTELTSFASEVCQLLNGPLEAGFGVIDITMIMGLIMAIVNAVKACKELNPIPAIV